MTVDYKTGLSFYKKDGEEYAELVNPTIHTNVSRAYYNFENMTSPQTGKKMSLISEANLNFPPLFLVISMSVAW